MYVIVNFKFENVYSQQIVSLSEFSVYYLQCCALEN